MSITRNFGRKLLSAGFILNGFVLMGLALTMEWIFGEGLGATWLEQRVYGGAHVSLHLFGMLCAFSIAMFLVDTSKAWAALAAVVAILVSSYSIIGVSGFGSKNSGGVAMAAEDCSERAMAKYHDDREYLQGQIKWLEGQSLDYDNAPKARKHYKAEAAKAKAMLDALEPPKVTAQTSDLDGSANALLRVTNLSSWEAPQVLAILVGLLLYISEVLSFILGVRVWPGRPDEVVGQDAMTDKADSAGLPTSKDHGLTVPADLPSPKDRGLTVPADLPSPKDHGLTVPADLPSPKDHGLTVPADLPSPKDHGLTVPADPPTGLGAAGRVPAAGLPAPKNRGLTMPAALPTEVAAAGMVPAAGLPEDMRQEKVLPVDMPSNLRNAHPAEHIGVVFAALRSLGLTHKVPSQVIRSLYSSLMVQTGLQPMATNTFCRHLAEVCERSRRRVGEIEGAASKTRAKVVVYTLPCDGTVEVGKKPPPAGAVKTARALSRRLSRAPSWANMKGHHALPTEGYARHRAGVRPYTSSFDLA
jgi:hypothetical protein